MDQHCFCHAMTDSRLSRDFFILKGYVFIVEHSELIVMLTHNDLTVLNAAEIFDQCKNSKAQYV